METLTFAVGVFYNFLVLRLIQKGGAFGVCTNGFVINASLGDGESVK
jgi:hypothetical protein